jgi:DnaJ-class molecular chaperone
LVAAVPAPAGGQQGVGVAIDPYQILGVARDAVPDAIRSAYRKLAKKYHPDLNPGDKAAEERFKEIASANDILSDADKRARYDRGEIDAVGNEKAPPRPSYRDASGGDFGGAAPGGDQYGGAAGLSAEDLASLFGDAFGFGAGSARARGGDVQYALTVDFLDAANGAVRRLSLPDGRTLDVTIPPGLRDGHVLRLKGQGRPGRGDATPGDALVEIAVAPHPFFRRDGNDVLLDLPVTLQEAVCGGSVEVPTVTGKVRLSIPPNSANGAKLRLTKRGIAGGNQIVELKLVLPPQAEPALAEFLAAWKPDHPFSPRAVLEGAS